MLIAEQYGLLLDFDALSRVLGKARGTLENEHYRGDLGIPMKKNGAKWVAHYEDVADYIDSFKSRSVAA